MASPALLCLGEWINHANIHRRKNTRTAKAGLASNRNSNNARTEKRRHRYAFARMERDATMRYRIVKTTTGQYGVQVKKWFRWVFIGRLTGREFKNEHHIIDFCLVNSLSEARAIKSKWAMKIEQVIEEF